MGTRVRRLSGLLVGLSAALAGCNAILGLDERPARPGAGGDGGIAAGPGGFGGGEAGRGGVGGDAGGAGGGGQGGTGAENAWLVPIPGAGQEFAQRIGVHEDGSVFVAGGFTGSIVPPGDSELTAVGGSDAFALRIAADGTPQWFWRLEEMGTTDLQRGFGAVTAGNQSFFAATSFGVVTVGGAQHDAGGGANWLLVAFDNSGMYQWSQSLGGTGVDRVRDLEFAVAGHLLIGGHMRTSATNIDVNGTTFNPNESDHTVVAVELTGAPFGVAISNEAGAPFGGQLDSALGGAIFMAGTATEPIQMPLLTRVGSGGFERLLTTPSASQGRDVEVRGTEGAVYAVAFVDSIDLGSGPIPSAGGRDILIAEYTTDGTLSWFQQVGGPSDDDVSSVHVLPNGEVLAFGTTAGGFDFAGDPVEVVGSTDLFLFRLDATGNPITHVTYGGAGQEVSFDGRPAPDGDYIVGARTHGTFTIGSASFTGAATDGDAFVAKLPTP